MKNLLEVDSIIFNFGEKRILSNVYLKCKTGETAGVLGRNGSGKSVLMRIIFGELDTPDKSIRINGKHVNKAFKIPGLIRYLPQFNFIPKSISIRDSFTFFKVDYNRFTKCFPEFSSMGNIKLIELSGGERRIVEVFCILTSNSKFCL